MLAWNLHFFLVLEKLQIRVLEFTKRNLSLFLCYLYFSYDLTWTEAEIPFYYPASETFEPEGVALLNGNSVNFVIKVTLSFNRFHKIYERYKSFSER